MAVLGPVEVVGVPELCTQLCAATRLWAAPRVVSTHHSLVIPPSTVKEPLTGCEEERAQRCHPALCVNCVCGSWG